MLFFTKAKRAQNVNDYESWKRGGVVPTLNAMDNNGEAYATVLIIDGTRVNDVRVYEDGIVPTVISRYGTGGGNVPMIFSHTQGLDAQPSEENSPTLRTGGNGMAVAFSPSDFANYSEGVGTLKAGMTNNNSPVIAFDAYNHTTSETNQTLRTGSDLDKMGTVFASSVVRRLTPVECERLQGFPDNWTDGQADSNRYKQMGNAVAVPVVEWIISRMVADD
jgi:site-specific DNA-cytosine methylase